MKLIPVILSGGAGSRLWPVSRLQHPKPFIRLQDGQSLLQKAFLRAIGLQDVDGLTIVTNRDFFFKTEDEFREVSQSKTSVSYILEPFGRNTAPAIAAAALKAFEEHGADAVLLVLAADHLISNESAFQQAVTQATELAVQGKLVTFGIHPHSPETGFGYIETQGHTVLRFVEKPSLERATEYIASGRFLWNSGMFCFTAGALLSELRQHCPEMVVSVELCIKQSRAAKGEGFKQLELDGDTFQQVPDDSIDYALMEKSDQVAVVPCDIGWSDIGSWLALGDLQTPDENGNRIQGEAELHNTHNCTIHSHDRLVGAVGVSNLVIIDTPDALLVANKTNAQDIKHIYTSLKSKGHDAHKLHQTVHRPWGTYSVLEEGNGFKIKRIEVKPGASLSLQMHNHRSEHWVVVAGVAKVINGEREIDIQLNESTFIPAGHHHRLTNPGKDVCVLIEVQTGTYLGEDDIVRLQDNYGRS
jgi:mannose-1-phosphate guanylyltransferase